MLNDFIFQWKLSRLQRRRRKVISDFQDRFYKAAEGKDLRNVRERLREDERFALNEWDNEIDVLTTAYLLQHARRLQLPIPDIDDEKYWTESELFGGRQLTNEGVTKLRAEIRTERKARWDFFSGHITLLIGLLGAIIGVLSVLKSK